MDAALTTGMRGFWIAASLALLAMTASHNHPRRLKYRYGRMAAMIIRMSDIG
jgi:hypothetical protein